MCCVNTYSATLNNIQRNLNSLHTLNVLGLRMSDILLTHIQTTSFKFSLHARSALYTLINKGPKRVPFVFLYKIL